MVTRRVSEDFRGFLAKRRVTNIAQLQKLIGPTGDTVGLDLLSLATIMQFEFKTFFSELA